MGKQDKQTKPINVTDVLNAMERWIKQRPGLDWRDYGTGTDACKAYQSEIRAIYKDRVRAMGALRTARELALGRDPRPEILADAFRAFSGRLEWNGQRLTYCTGQYWPTEYRKAAAAVLETYIAGWKQAENDERPRTFRYQTMDDVKNANEAIGNHWFEPSTMRFFKTRIESRLIVCGELDTAGVYQEGTRGRFITSEQGPDGKRLYTVREAMPDGTIDTIGEFQQFGTLADAKAHVLMNRPETERR